MIIFRQINSKDFDKWRSAYHYYAEHYEVSLTEEGIKTTWNWLMDDKQTLRGIVAENKNNIIGIAHYRAMPSPLRGKYIGFLDAIIIIPEIGLVTLIRGVCNAGVTAHTTKYPTNIAKTNIIKLINEGSTLCIFFSLKKVFCFFSVLNYNRFC